MKGLYDIPYHIKYGMIYIWYVYIWYDIYIYDEKFIFSIFSIMD